MRSCLLDELDLVGLDERVREQPLAHALELRLHVLAISVAELEVDHPSDPRIVDRKTELAERAENGLPLGIEDPRLWPDEYGRLHRSTVSGSARYSSKPISVRRSNASM